MPLELHYSLYKAGRILGRLKKALPENVKGTICVWSNGREQGYHVSCGDYAVVFAECRGSDEIIVIHGLRQNFDITTNMPNEKLWKDHYRTFATIKEAVEYIADYLTFGSCISKEITRKVLKKLS